MMMMKIVISRTIQGPRLIWITSLPPSIHTQHPYLWKPASESATGLGREASRPGDGGLKGLKPPAPAAPAPVGVAAPLELAEDADATSAPRV